MVIGLNKLLFWDTDPERLDKYKHKRVIIERLLKFGTMEDIKWLLKNYIDIDIIEVVKKSKSIDRKTANFWMIHFNIPKEEIVCLNRSLIQKEFY